MSKETEKGPSEGSEGPGAGKPPEGQEKGSEGRSEGSDGQPETFSAEYVKKLRDENAAYRHRGKSADEMARALVTEYARSTGRLADPTDLPFSDALLNEDGKPDSAKVIAAVEELIERKPYLAAIKVSGDVGQGAGETNTMPGLADMLRAGAG